MIKKMGAKISAHNTSDPFSASLGINSSRVNPIISAKEIE